MQRRPFFRQLFVIFLTTAVALPLPALCLLLHQNLQGQRTTRVNRTWLSDHRPLAPESSIDSDDRSQERQGVVPSGEMDELDLDGFGLSLWLPSYAVDFSPILDDTFDRMLHDTVNDARGLLGALHFRC